MSNKTDRINSEIHKALTSILSNELRDPRLSGMITIVTVDVSADLSNCKVFVTVLASNEQEEKENFEILKSSASYIRRSLSKKLNLRLTPVIHFYLDNTWKEGAKMDKLLSSLDIPKEE